MKPHYTECGCCGYWHLATYFGDCRNDAERFTLDQLDAIHKPGGYTIEGEDDMGYTHYWTQPRNFTPEEFLQISDAARTIIETASGRKFPFDGSRSPEHELVICNMGGDRGSRPELSDKCISLNGMGPELEHETFMIEAAPGADTWTFCKTARKPYDVVVVAILTYLAADWAFAVSSDGDVDDWEAGIKLAGEALGREFPNPLIVEQLVG